MKGKKKGPDAVKQPGPQRTTRKVERQIKNRIKELETQEARILLDFMATRPPDELTLNRLELVWHFLLWLRAEDYSIVQADDLLTAPFSKFAKIKDLK